MHAMSSTCQAEPKPTCSIASGFKSCTASVCSMEPFAPDQQIRKLRTFMRLRDNLVVASTQAVHHMQKALFEMNVQLSNVISDIVGQTGLSILEAIIAGQRDPQQLAALCGSRIKAL